MSRNLEPSEAQQMRATAMRMRLQKFSYQAIAEKLGKSTTTIQNWVADEVRRCIPIEEAEQLRSQEGYTLDELELNARNMLVWMEQRNAEAVQMGEAAPYGSDDFIKTSRLILDVQQRRTKLMGLDKPVLVQHTHKVRTEFDEEIEALVSELTGGGKVLSQPDDIDVPQDA